MVVRKPFNNILYVAFLFGAILFVNESVSDYISNRSSYTVTKEPLSFKDLPTLTVSFDAADFEFITGKTLNLSNDFFVSVKVYSKQGLPLHVFGNKSGEKIFGLVVQM